MEDKLMKFLIRNLRGFIAGAFVASVALTVHAVATYDQATLQRAGLAALVTGTIILGIVRPMIVPLLPGVVLTLIGPSLATFYIVNGIGPVGVHIFGAIILAAVGAIVTYASVMDVRLKQQLKPATAPH